MILIRQYRRVISSFMGDIKTRVFVRSSSKAKLITCTWDCGSPWTFINESTAKQLGKPWELGEPQTFHGLGNGSFAASKAMLVHFKLKGVWCRYLVWVVDDGAMPGIDILIGHEFMETYNIRLDPKKKNIAVSKKDLLQASLVF